MHKTISAVFATFTLSLAACSGSDFTVGDPQGDAGNPDTGTGGTDSGPPDTGTGGTDSGTPDTGTGGEDSGVTPDSGSDAAPDSGSGGSDAGTDSGSGGTDAGGSDAGTDSGPGGSDAGDAGGSDAGGSDAGGSDAGECSGDIVGCFSGQPKICISSKWELAGGVCTWSCSAGKCGCSAGSRFTGPPFFLVISDSKTGHTWIWQVASPPGSLDVTTAKVQCGSSYRLPTAAEVLDIIAQQAPASLCATTQNLDPIFYGVLKTYVGGAFPTEASLFDLPIWTQDTSAGLQVTVQLNTGNLGTRSPVTKVAGILLCISK